MHRAAGDALAAPTTHASFRAANTVLQPVRCAYLWLCSKAFMKTLFLSSSRVASFRAANTAVRSHSGCVQLCPVCTELAEGLLYWL